MAQLAKWKHRMLNLGLNFLVCSILYCSLFSCSAPKIKNLAASEILGNPSYPALCYGGYRSNSRKIEPSRAELKEDLIILSALGIRILRTYHAAEFG
ncbi:MAG: hypothetical protein ACJASM_001174, partial [Salibacteraceae bacterium]